jgi:transposase-like protein
MTTRLTEAVRRENIELSNAERVVGKNMGGETSQAWRIVPNALIKRGLRQPEFLVVDGGTGLEQALAALWGDVPTQRCTVHKHRNLLAHAPQRRHEAVSADYNDLRGRG